jgi:DNA topoisomerase IA
MNSAKYDVIELSLDNKGYSFNTNARQLNKECKCYLEAYQVSNDFMQDDEVEQDLSKQNKYIVFETLLNNWTTSSTSDSKVYLDANSLDIKEKETIPPYRYSESSLIKKLDLLSIGRPSTYTFIISRLKANYYIESENKRLISTQLGKEAIQYFNEWFPTIINYDYTKQMEEDLDKIAKSESTETQILANLYETFEPVYLYAKANKPIISQGICPECGKTLVRKLSRFGSFIACSGYPDCHYTLHIKTVKPKTFYSKYVRKDGTTKPSPEDDKSGK